MKPQRNSKTICIHGGSENKETKREVFRTRMAWHGLVLSRRELPYAKQQRSLAEADNHRIAGIRIYNAQGGGTALRAGTRSRIAF